ncbi:uncharacterized protein LOC125503049 isoform X2 [Dendroctonus ponderosae]|uniref:Uncharacterized protein n=1 Tax=Dendroctonus ponderosae TaxID=77166 RepID=A0AAR5PL45_DENPD|nr:uncharacterized protein LOC109538812 isoform X2 [Dendroctonus ponderosae]XP_048518737.1 uncharacterized protein LOC125503049 isoform X2 [Dendroctonus ponderosae]
MTEPVAKRDFLGILSNLNRKFEITDSKWTEEKAYEIKFRTQIRVEHNDYNQYCDKWVEEFSFLTDTIWVHKISNTGPKVKFRKQYQCWAYESKEVKKELLFDARKCRATLDVKVLGNTINFQHLHPVDTSQAYAFFVHWCNPVADAPKPSAPAIEKVAQLVAKEVHNAAKTSQKAGERLNEALEKQRMASADELPNQSTNLTGCANTSICHLQPQSGNRLSLDQPPLAKVIVNTPDGQTSENIFYIHQVVFDSTTQTLTEVPPDQCGGLPDISNHQLIQVQLPDDPAQKTTLFIDPNQS